MPVTDQHCSFIVICLVQEQLLPLRDLPDGIGLPFVSENQTLSTFYSNIVIVLTATVVVV